MKPSEVYALPSQSVMPWFESYSSIMQKLFGAKFYEFDTEAAQEDGSRRFTIQEKLSCFIDWGERTASVSAAYFDDKPFAIYSAAGRGEKDYSDIIVTDAELFEAARAEVDRWRANRTDHDVVTGDEDIPALSAFYGVIVVDTPTGTVLTRSDYVDRKSGTLMFDVRAYNEAFDEKVRPLYQTGARFDDADRLFQRDDVRRAFAESLMAGVAPGLNAVLFNGEAPPTGNPRVDANPDWYGVIFATDDATYAVKIHSSSRGALGLSWASDKSVRRIGGPELIEAFRAEAETPSAPAPR